MSKTNRKSHRQAVAPVVIAPPVVTNVSDVSPEQRENNVRALLALLRDSADKKEKKKIRAALRRNGHRGGLRDVTRITTEAQLIERGRAINAA